MIVEEIDSKGKSEEEIRKIKEMLDLDFSLPKDYSITFESLGFISRKHRFLIFPYPREIAYFWGDNDTITIIFFDRKEYELIKTYLNDSKIKFKIKLNSYY